MEHHNSHTEHNHHKVEHQQHSSHSQSGHDKHAGHNVADFWKRFIVCLIVSIPVLALSQYDTTMAGI